MRSGVSKVVVFLLCIAILFVFPSVSWATEHPYGIWIDVDYDSVPRGAVYLDLLVPASEMETTTYNGNKQGIPENCEIARYHKCGLVSYTFRCPWAEEQKQKLSDPVTASTDWSFYPGYTFTRVRVAYLDETGHILGVTNTCFLNYPFECNEQLFLRGKRLIADPLAFASVEPATGYYDVNAVNIYSVSAVVLIAAAAVLIAVAAMVIWLPASRISRKRYLPSFFFQKGSQMDADARKKKISGGVLYVLIRLFYLVFIYWIFARTVFELKLQYWYPLSVCLPVEAAAFLLFRRLCVVLHKAGHCCAGKKKGFVACHSVKTPQAARARSRYHITDDFVFLSPPEEDPASIAFAPVYYAGPAANLLFGIVLLALCFLIQQPLLRNVLLLGVAQNFYPALINLLPCVISGFPGDAVRLKNAVRSAETRAIHTDTLRISAAYCEGTAMDQMRGEWFHFPSDEALADPCGASNAALLFYRLLTECRFKDAKSLGLRLIAPECALYEGAKSRVLEELVFCMAVTGCAKEEIESFFGRERRRAVLRLRRSPSELRIMFAWELLIGNDMEKAIKIRTRYETHDVFRSLPAAADADRKLMDACVKAFEQRR